MGSKGKTVRFEPTVDDEQNIDTSIKKLIKSLGFDEEDLKKLFEPAVMSILDQLPSDATDITERAITYAAYAVYKNMEQPFHKMTGILKQFVTNSVQERFKGCSAITEIRHTISKSREYQLFIRKNSKTPLISALTKLEGKVNMAKYNYNKFLELNDDENYITSLIEGVNTVKQEWNKMYSTHHPAKSTLLKTLRKEGNITLSDIKHGSYSFMEDTLGLAQIEDTWTPCFVTNHHIYIQQRKKWEAKHDLLEPVKFINIQLKK